MSSDRAMNIGRFYGRTTRVLARDRCADTAEVHCAAAFHVLIVDLDSDQKYHLCSLLTLLGVSFSNASSARGICTAADLVFTSSPRGSVKETDEECTITLGQKGAFTLPDDQTLITQIVMKKRAMVKAKRLNPIVAIAGWHGGAGVTSLAFSLACQASGAVIDVSGEGGGGGEDEHQGVTWSDLRAGEISYGTHVDTHFPLIHGTRALMAGGNGGVYADDPRLETLVQSTSDDVPLILDAGRWNKRCKLLVSGRTGRDSLLQRGQHSHRYPGNTDNSYARTGAGIADIVCLAGRSDANFSLRLVQTLHACRPTGPLILAYRGRITQEFRMVCDVCSDAKLWRFRGHGNTPQGVSQLWKICVQMWQHTHSNKENS